MTGCIVGWAHTKFGKLEGDLETLIAEAGSAAIRDAGLAPDEIDAIYVANFGGFEKQGFPASLALVDPALRFRPATRVENACASGSAAIRVGLDNILSGQSRLVIVVGAEKMTSTPGGLVGDVLLNAAYRKEEGDTEGGFAGIFARIAQLYFQRYGDKSDVLARIAAKNHRNGVENPYAQIRKDLGFDFCNRASEKNPLVAAPLRRTDCSPVSDGAAAIVLADTETALRMKKAVHIRAMVQANDYLPMSRRDIVAFEGCREAWMRAHEAAGTRIDNLDLVETHDCFTIAELIEYEAMGLAIPGEGHRVIESGVAEKGGRLPVNPSGGLKSKGHPVGATGVSMHVMGALQLMGEAEGMQVENASLAGIYNMGGAAVANYVSILERLR